MTTRTVIAADGTVTTRELTAGEVAALAALGVAPVNSDSVNAERDRRIRVGKTFTVPGYGAVAVEGREVDMRNLGALGTAALAAIGAGQDAATMQFRGADNTIHTLTWAQMFALWQLSTAYVSAIYSASWALKDAPPIPADYANNSYWPG